MEKPTQDSSQCDFFKREVLTWKKNQQLCDIANIIVKKLLDGKVSVKESYDILEKVKNVIEDSTLFMELGGSMSAIIVRNTAFPFHDYASLIDTLNPQKDQNDS